MVTPLLINPEEIDPNRVIMGKDRIREVNPHRYEMEQLDGILKLDKDNHIIVGYKDIRPDEFWVRGHIPGRPLMPGVIMIEVAAQLCSFYYKMMDASTTDKFIGFGGVDKVKFRGTVQPGDKLIVVSKCLELRSRRAVFETQGMVNGRLVFEATIIGMPV